MSERHFKLTRCHICQNTVFWTQKAGFPCSTAQAAFFPKIDEISTIVGFKTLSVRVLGRFEVPCKGWGWGGWSEKMRSGFFFANVWEHHVSRSENPKQNQFELDIRPIHIPSSSSQLLQPSILRSSYQPCLMFNSKVRTHILILPISANSNLLDAVALVTPSTLVCQYLR